MKNFETITDIIILPYAEFWYKFNSPQVKRNLTSPITNFIYKLRPELPKAVTLGNYEMKNGP